MISSDFRFTVRYSFLVLSVYIPPLAHQTAIFVVGFKKESHVMYCQLPQYEARLLTGGDSGGAWSRKLRLERAATLPVRPQSHMVLPRGFEPLSPAWKADNLANLSMGAYQWTVYTVVSSTVTFGSGLGYETWTHTSCDGTFWVLCVCHSTNPRYQTQPTLS